MWSEDINKKIEEGENRNDPNIPDTAWNGMELLLDKHLPLKKKRRRFVLWLLPALLGAGLITFYLLQETGKPGPTTDQKNTAALQAHQQPGGTPEKNATTVLPDEKNPSENLIDHPVSKKPGQIAIKKINTGDTSYNPPALTPTATASNKKPITANEQPLGNTKNLKTSPQDDQRDLLANAPITHVKDKDATVPGKPIDNSTTQNIPDQQMQSNLTPVNPDIAIGKDKPAATIEENKPADSLPAVEKKPVQQKKSSFADKLSLTLAFGPDISAVSMANPGQVQFQYGLGVTYAITKNLAIRTGFYAGDKKYTADSADYHNPYSIANLEKVDADCFVYEIPLNVVYNFNPVKKHSWFISAGVSSYIMKKETYGYYYQNSWGQPQYYSRTYKNENKHLFSVIGISAGYQYTVSNKLSLFAEPYIKFPVSGIGTGKVKLNNTGILFTVGYKPFSKK